MGRSFDTFAIKTIGCINDLLLSLQSNDKKTTAASVQCRESRRSCGCEKYAKGGTCKGGKNLLTFQIIGPHSDKVYLFLCKRKNLTNWKQNVLATSL